MPVLPAADGLGVAADALTELLLGEADGLAGGAELRTDDPAAGEYPVGRGLAVHPIKAWVILVRSPYPCG